MSETSQPVSTRSIVRVNSDNRVIDVKATGTIKGESPGGGSIGIIFWLDNEWFGSPPCLMFHRK
jgi:hypothetical protein